MVSTIDKNGLYITMRVIVMMDIWSYYIGGIDLIVDIIISLWSLGLNENVKRWLEIIKRHIQSDWKSYKQKHIRNGEKSCRKKYINLLEIEGKYGAFYIKKIFVNEKCFI